MQKNDVNDAIDDGVLFCLDLRLLMMKPSLADSPLRNASRKRSKPNPD
jgi:hypothetical protein